jgi:hypothetical protein
MKRFSGTITLLLAVVVILGGAAKLAAQDKLTITIPFAFTANHQFLPAGAYNVNWLSDRYMALRNAKTSETHVVMVRPEQGQVIESRGRFVFLRDGGRYYLARVWKAGSSVHSEMTVQHQPERATELAKAPVPKTIEINVN